MKQIEKWKWPVIFLLITGLTQSNLIIDYATHPGWLGFPIWIWWYILFHILFVITLYFFVKTPQSSA